MILSDWLNFKASNPNKIAALSLSDWEITLSNKARDPASSTTLIAPASNKAASRSSIKSSESSIPTQSLIKSSGKFLSARRAGSIEAWLD